MSDVFISYSRRDQVFARRLFERVRKEELEGWADWEGIPYGTEWKTVILQSIDATKNFVFVVSPDSLTSQVCHLELEHARNHNKRIIPIMRREPDMTKVAGQWYGKPFEELARDNWEFLKDLNWVLMRKKSDSAFDCDYDPDTRKVINEECDGPDSDADNLETAFHDLVNTVKTDQAYIDEHARLLVKAKHWKQKRGGLLRGDELQQSEAWLLSADANKYPPTEDHREYIRTSRITANRQRRALITVLSSLLVVALILAALSLIGFQNANVERVRADENAATSDANAIIAENNAATATVALATSTVAQGEAIFNQQTAVAETNLRATAQYEAEEQTIRALSRQLASQALNPSIMESDISLSLLMLLQAIEFDSENLEAKQNLNTVLNFDPGLEANLWHEASPITVKVSPTDPLIVTGDTLGNIYFWDANSYHLLDGPLKVDHDDNIDRLYFSADGTLVASIARDHTVVVWDVETRQPIFSDFEFDSNQGVMTPDGKYLIGLNDEDSDADIVLRIWDIQTRETVGEPILVYPNSFFWDIAVSPDSRYIAVPDSRTDEIVLWSIPEGQRVTSPTFDDGIDRIATIAFSPDGTLLAVGGCALDIPTDSCIRGEVKVWSVSTGELIGPALVTSEKDVTGGGAEGAASVWRLDISDDGKYLAAIEMGVTEGNHVQIWNLEDFSLVYKTQPVLNGAIDSVDIAPDGSYFVATNVRERISIWNLNQPSTISSQLVLPAPSSGFARFEMTADGTQIAISFMPDNVVSIIDTQSNEVIRQIPTYHQYGISELAIDPTSRVIAVAGPYRDGGISLWDFNDGTFIRSFPVEYRSGIMAMDFSPDGSVLAVGDIEGFVTLWDVDTATQIRSLHHDYLIAYMEYASEDLIITRDSLGTINFWNAETGNQVGNSITFSEAPLLLFAGFSLDSSAQHFAAVRPYGVDIWDVNSRQVIGEFPLEDGAITTAMSPDGRFLAIEDYKGRILIYDVDTSAQINDIGTGSVAMSALRFTPSTNRLYGAGLEGAGFLAWDTNPDELRTKACSIINRHFLSAEWEEYVGVGDVNELCLGVAGIATSTIDTFETDASISNDTQDIEPGISVSGTISENQQSIWQFEGLEGQYAFIILEPNDSISDMDVLDGVLSLYDPEGSLLIRSDDPNSYYAYIRVFQLPKTGRYEIKVSSHDTSKSGAYDLELNLLETQEINFNDTIVESLGEREYQLWNFKTDISQRISIIFNEFDDTSLSFWLYAAGSNELLPALASDYSSTTDYLLEPGEYLLRIGASEPGEFSLLILDEEQRQMLFDSVQREVVINSPELEMIQGDLLLCHVGYTPLLNDIGWGVAWLQNVGSQTIDLSLQLELDSLTSLIQSSASLIRPQDIGFVVIPDGALEGSATSLNLASWGQNSIEANLLISDESSESNAILLEDLSINLISHYSDRGLPPYFHHSIEIELNNTNDELVEADDIRALFVIYDESRNVVDIGYKTLEELEIEIGESVALRIDSLSQSGSCVRQQSQDEDYEIWIGLAYTGQAGGIHNLFEVFPTGTIQFDNQVIGSVTSLD